jgi:hypothetical protein
MVLARERFGHDAVRANLDLPDFFEDLAGNHGCALILISVMQQNLKFFPLPQGHIS